MKLIPIRKQNMPMMSLWGDMMERFFNEDIEQDSKMMAVDILESPQTYDIKANLPGIPKEKINISVKDNRILISA
ncbi:MAG: Hsp20 family protein, partial [Candidatus Cloacimonetes bacterium]|nr:Hsp20 family protein [Candidatus Cloacimonadota bacterium]